MDEKKTSTSKPLSQVELPHSERREVLRAQLRVLQARLDAEIHISREDIFRAARYADSGAAA